nr:copia protein [Tanacetum cinerariifolium]
MQKQQERSLFEGRKPESEGKSPIKYSTGYRNLSVEFEDFSDNIINEDNAPGSLVHAVGQLFANSTNTFSAAGPSNAAVSPTHGKSSAIGTKWAFRNKKDERGIVVRDKARLVAQGHTQEEEINYEEVFAPVARIEAISTNTFSAAGPSNAAVSTKWAFRNKKDERGIVVRNKARLVTQGHTQDEGINYEEVFAPVARIEAIRLFLAYASFMGFMVYQIDVKSAFLYETIKEEVYVCQHLGFEGFTKWSRLYMDYIKLLELDGKSASTSIDTEKPLLKDPDGEDVDVHTYKSMIGSLIEATIRDTLRLDDAKGIDCLPNEEIFIELARMGYEKPSTKLTFYKAFFSSQWKFMIHTILQCMSAKRTSWNEFSFSMVSAVICLSTDIPSTSQVQPTPPQSPQPQPQLPQKQPQPSQDAKISMDLLHNQLDTCTTLTRRVEKLEQDKIAQALEITKLKQRVKKLKRRNKLKGRMIADMDADVDVTLKDIAKDVVVDAECAARRKKGVVIRYPKETTTPSTIIHSEAKSKDKGKGILVEEPKPFKKQAQIEQDEAYTRELEAELNKNIGWDDVIDHVQRKEKEDNAVKSSAGSIHHLACSRPCQHVQGVKGPTSGIRAIWRTLHKKKHFSIHKNLFVVSMESLSPQVVSAAKLPILNPIEFDLWKMRIEQYFLMTDYSLWEVILNGDSPAPTRVIEGVVQPVAPTTVEQRLARKNELKLMVLC